MIPEGWEGHNFKGDFLRLTNSWNGKDHKGYLWRDDIRSIRIIRKPYVGCNHHNSMNSTIVTAFEHNFEGAQLKLNGNWTVGGLEGHGWNDMVGMTRYHPFMYRREWLSECLNMPILKEDTWTSKDSGK